MSRGDKGQTSVELNLGLPWVIVGLLHPSGQIQVCFSGRVRLVGPPLDYPNSTPHTVAGAVADGLSAAQDKCLVDI